MKSLAELEAIRKKTINNVTLRTDDDAVRVVVGMATCGISAGARPVMTTFIEEIGKRNLGNVNVTQTGCVGMCRLEPIVEIYTPDGEKVTYVKMDPEKVKKVVAEHLVNGKVVTEYTIGAAE